MTSIRNTKGQFLKGTPSPCGATGKHWKLSPETRAKMSAARKGEKRPYQSGEANGNWRGGVSKKNKGERQLAMETIEYKNWRRTVFERDGYKCVNCGDDKGGNLQADHIVPVALRPELMLDIENGRTLCEFCHEKITTAFNRVYFKTHWKNAHGVGIDHKEKKYE